MCRGRKLVEPEVQLMLWLNIVGVQTGHSFKSEATVALLHESCDHRLHSVPSDLFVSSGCWPDDEAVQDDDGEGCHHAGDQPHGGDTR